MLLRASLKPCNMVGASCCLFCDWELAVIATSPESNCLDALIQELDFDQMVQIECWSLSVMTMILEGGKLHIKNEL